TCCQVISLFFFNVDFFPNIFLFVLLNWPFFFQFDVFLTHSIFLNQILFLLSMSVEITNLSTLDLLASSFYTKFSCQYHNCMFFLKFLSGTSASLQTQHPLIQACFNYRGTTRVNIPIFVLATTLLVSSAKARLKFNRILNPDLPVRSQ
ncbi:hypothetical protein L9F63_000170, partial [Diploptera punctata]